MAERLPALSGAERSSPDRLRMKHRAVRSRVKELEGEVERLRSLNRQLQQATYGRRSERRCRSQRRGARPAPGERRSRGQQRGAPGHGRTPRPALPVVEQVVEAPARRCAHCARPYAANGASVTQLIEVEVSAYVRRIHRPRTRARCRCAPASEAVAPPARLFANTAYGVSVWAWFVLECYAYHRPLRAVARALATMGIPIAPGTLADAQSRLLRVFEPLDEAIAERQRPASLVQGDETRWMIHVRGERGENPRCWLWLCVSADAVRMHIDPTRSARAARVALLRMHREGVIALPPARKRPGPRKPIAPSPETDPPSLFEPPTSLEAVRPLCIEPLASRAEGRLWNAFVARYHYLGHHPLPGAQIRYFVRAFNGEPLAVLGFGAAAWKTAPRDEFIGWSPAVRQRNLALVVNNARFLILPWIRIRNLASHLLAQLQRRLPHDWERRYALRPVLLETFCESARFLGTCYQSANWLCVGHTQGRGKLDVHRQSSLPVKSVWLRPLHKNWRQILCR